MSMRLALAIAFTASLGWSQVRVGVRTNQLDYLVGEPIFAIVEVTNIGAAPVGFAECLSRVNLTVPGAPEEKVPNLRGCFSGSRSSADCLAEQNLPQLAAGEKIAVWPPP